MNKIIRWILIVLLLVLSIPKREVYEDGGTTTYTSMSYKIISWNQIEGKKGLEIYFFPNNSHSLSYYE